MSELEEFYKIVDKEARKHNIPGMEWQDIAQEVKMRLWAKFKLYDPSKSGFRTWANKVMRNCITDLLRTANYKKAQYLNRAISTEGLKEQGLDVAPNGKIYRVTEEE